jgi:uncharacterized membrane protein
MGYLPFAVLGYLLNSIAVTVDKFLLTKSIPDPLVYVFYFSVASLLSLVVLPFVPIPPQDAIVISSVSTILWTIGAYFMFKALQIGQVSRVIPIIGTLIPLILLIQAIFNNSITINQAWAVWILVLGMVFLTLPDWRGKITIKEIYFTLFSAIFFAISYILLNLSYIHAYAILAPNISTDKMAIAVLAYSRFVLIPVGLVLILIPNLRQKIFIKKGSPSFKLLSKVGLLFVFGQTAGGTSGLFINFAISKATPALVNSLQGVQYVFLFALSLILAQKFPKIFYEKLSNLNIMGKIVGILLISLGLFVLSFETYSPKITPTLGVTYSPRYAKSLNLDPKKTFVQLVADLNPKSIRLPLYWDEVEPQKDQFDFSSINFYVNYAQQKNIDLVLVLGYKQPRWPECFAPNWTQKLNSEQKMGAILDLVDAEVNFFKKYPNIKIWQIENEPFLGFGICPKPDPNGTQLINEISLVKSIDSRRVMITDSGELSFWVNAMQNGDVFGTTIYRTVWNQYLGMVDYPLPPFFYQFKAIIVQFITQNQKPIIISELQTEPWQTQPIPLDQIPVSEQASLFSSSKLVENLNFAKQTNFSPIYLWGAEWWYFMQKNGHPEYLQQAQKLIRTYH